MRKKILLNYILILIISSFLTGYIAYYTIKVNHLESKEDKYISNMKLIESSILGSNEDFNNLNYFRMAQFYSDLTSARVTFIRNDGYPLADSDNNSIIFDNFSDSQGFKNALIEDSKLYSEYSREMGKNYHYYSSLLKFDNNNGVILRIGETIDSTDRLIDNFLLYLMIAIFGSLIIASILSYITVENLIRPLRILTNTSKLVAAGDFSQTVEIDSDDEIGDLTTSFNSMTKELNSYVSSMKEVERMRKDFVANISHELRTPLTSILGFIETLKIEDLDENTKIKSLNIIEAESLRLRELINKLLILSKVESMREEKSLKAVDIDKIITEVINVLSQQISEKDLNVNVGFEDSKFTIRSDEGLIKLVLINLVENSIKYNVFKGSIWINVMEEDSNIKIKVKDTGIGIPEDQLDKIFERFYRIDSSRNISTGSGLGLAISKHIVSGLGGSIEVESSKEKGTIFSVIFPKDFDLNS